MDPVEAWVDQEEVKRLVESLSEKPERIGVESAEAAYGEGFVGFGADADTAVAEGTAVVYDSISTTTTLAEPTELPNTSLEDSPESPDAVNEDDKELSDDVEGGVGESLNEDSDISDIPEATDLEKGEGSAGSDRAALEPDLKSSVMGPISEGDALPPMGAIPSSSHEEAPAAKPTFLEKIPAIGKITNAVTPADIGVDTPEVFPNPFSDEKDNKVEAVEREWQELEGDHSIEQPDPFEREGQSKERELSKLEEDNEDDGLDKPVDPVAKVSISEGDGLAGQDVIASPFQEAKKDELHADVPVAAYANGEVIEDDEPSSTLEPKEPESEVSAEDKQSGSDLSASFLDRIKSFGEWTKGSVNVDKYFVFDRDGKILIDEVGSANLLQIAKTLANATMASQRRGGDDARAGTHMKISASSFLEVVPTKTKYGALVFGGIIPKGLSEKEAVMIAEKLRLAADGE